MAEKGPIITVDYNGTTLDYMRKILIAIVRIVTHTVNHYVVLPHVFWMIVLRPLMYVKPEWYWFLEGISFNWLLMLVASWSFNAGYIGKYFHLSHNGCERFSFQLVLFQKSHRMISLP